MKRLFCLTILIFSITILLYAPISFALSTGITVTTKGGQNLHLYDDYQAVVVGAGDYQSWPKLPHVAKDAGEIADKLKTIGFHVKLVLNPTSGQLRTILSNLTSPIGNNPNRAVLFYYIGHGATETSADNTRMGYIIPVDCPLPSQNRGGFFSHAISMKDIETASMKMKAKHVIMLFDACFSGSQFALSRPAPEDITVKSNTPVRQYIIAGTEGEKAPEKRMFNRCFLTGLDGYADLSEDGYITGTELALYLSDIVANSTQRKQHPQYGKIRHGDLNKGEFVFVTSKVSQQEEKKKQKRVVELENDIKTLDTAIMKSKDEQRRMEARRHALLKELKTLRGETVPDEETRAKKGASTESPSSETIRKRPKELEERNRVLEEQNKKPEPTKRKAVSKTASEPSATDRVDRQLKMLQERTRMLEEQYEKLKAERLKMESEKASQSTSAEHVDQKVERARERNRMLEEEYKKLKAEKRKREYKEEESNIVQDSGPDDKLDESFLGAP